MVADSRRLTDGAVPPNAPSCPTPSCRFHLAILAETLPFVTCIDHRQVYLLDDLLRGPAPPIGTRETDLLAWQERASLLRRLAAQALREGHPLIASSLHERAGMLEERVRQARRWLLALTGSR